MELSGTVRNVVDFGAFVNIGVKQDGLVHVSRMANRFIKRPSEVVSVGDTVKVWGESIDKERGKIGTGMVESKLSLFSLFYCYITGGVENENKWVA
jgi:uncharacterized protein